MLPKNTKRAVLALGISAALMAGCQQTAPTAANDTAAQTAQSETVAKTPSEQANAIFEQIFMSRVMRSPTYQTYLGIKDNQHLWDDGSEAEALKNHELDKADLAKVKAINPDNLDEQSKISLILMKKQLKERIADYQWRHHNYPVSQMYGPHTGMPSLLINQHRIGSVADAEAYISRLKGMSKAMDQLIVSLKLRADKGIIAPSFVYPYAIQDSRNIISGAPFDDGKDSTLMADFRGKVNKLEVSDQQKQALLGRAAKALKNNVKPAYESLIGYLAKLEKKAPKNVGANQFPNGTAYYNNALNRTTSTDLTAEQIHDIGLKEVERIHGEMRGIMKEVGFKGDLQAFFEFMRTDKQFYFSEDAKGKQQYLDGANELIAQMKGRLHEVFSVTAKADMQVKAVEPFREASAGKAFYQRPSLSGDRPGTYYVNLFKMSDMPSYQMAALAYHEGMPGHHMQLAIAQELEGIPKFRQFAQATAYTEGWGLYAEFLPKEMGFYQDPYSDFGRLAMELWRACRLVLDTGLHTKGWTREYAIEYLGTNTPNPHGDVVKAVERYIVIPSQATAYKIGMLRILELREKARKAMGDKFDIRHFHDVVLKNGPLPLDMLEQFVDEYIAEAG